jgi:glucose-fructose oxidoreductase
MPEVLRRDVILGLGAAATLAACGSDQSAGRYRKLGVAVVGVGGVATRSVLPALNRSAFCRVAALVGTDAARLKPIGEKFGVPVSAQYTQDTFDRIADNPDVDLVYIAVPNALHAPYTIRAARAGKHVLCEKPMAVTVAECEEMIAACEAAGKSLAVGYRVHFSAHHQEMLRTLQKKEFGEIQMIRADIGYPLKGEGGWRLKRALAGGGVLLEQGVYPVNSARTMMGADPVEVLGYEMKSDTRRFAEVEETVSWSMRFANDTVAHCAASYTVPANRVWAGSPSGWFELESAYSLDEIQARSAQGDHALREPDQFLEQVDHFSRLIQDGKPVGAGISGADGLRDVRIITAIYESIRTRKVVQLQTV